jgi:hypothetical protein
MTRRGLLGLAIGAAVAPTEVIVQKPSPAATNDLFRTMLGLAKVPPEILIELTPNGR